VPALRVVDAVSAQPAKDPSSWRALDLGVWKVTIRAYLRRLSCPTHGVVVEAVPFARHNARVTYDGERLVAWSATKMDQTAVTQLTRTNWRTVGEVINRVVADELDPQRLENLCDIGVDEISYKKHHNYLTIVVDHHTGNVVWADEGKDSATLDRFFDKLGADQATRLTAVSCEVGRAYPKSVAEHALQATICWEAFHVVALATKALDAVRRAHWNMLRKTDAEAARKFKAQDGRC
jgi:transposase